MLSDRAVDEPIKANGATLRTMERLKPLLQPWPAILPTADNPEIRPLAIGLDKAILARLNVSDDAVAEARKQIKQAIKALVQSPQYRRVRDAPGSMRHDIDGNPVEPVADEHKTGTKPKQKPANLAAPTVQKPKETIIVAVKVKALKVTAVVPPADLKPVPVGADVIMMIEVIDGIKAQARLNPKSYRKALEVVREHGAENVAVIVQGQMTKPGVIESAGISAMPKKPKA